MHVRFLIDYQGYATGPHFYRAGTVTELPDAVAAQVIRDGHAEPVRPSVDWEAHTVAELVEMARDRDISGYSAMRKAELIEVLRGD